MNLKHKIALVLVVLGTKGFSQWEYRADQENNTAEVVGTIQFNYEIQDSVTLHLSKSRKWGLDLSIKCNLFKKAQKYYALFEISDQKIKVKEFMILNQRLRILQLEDLVSNEKYEVEDFLKILKRGKDCTLTLRSEDRVIQGYNSLSGITLAINSILNFRLR